MKKKYQAPEFDVVTLRLTDSLMTPSIETDQSSWAGGGMNDPGEETIGGGDGFWFNEVP